jgi:sulfite exporter TauE/SafE
MNAFQLLPVFLVGLLGSVHCVGMCGGIVGAFSAARRVPPARMIPLQVQGAAVMQASALDQLLYGLACNGGRLASYAIAGAIAGGVAQSARTFTWLSSIQTGGYWLANLMLVALGLYLMNAWRGLAHLEAAGQAVWRHVQPLVPRLMPIDHPGKAVALGALWGWVPCGMVYSVLLTAMATGSAASGAAVMLAFGLGTLPMLLGLGALGTGLLAWTRKPAVRTACGLLILGFGLAGLARAVGGLSLGWIDALCISTAPWGAH